MLHIHRANYLHIHPHTLGTVLYIPRHMISTYLSIYNFASPLITSRTSFNASTAKATMFLSRSGPIPVSTSRV